MPKKSVRRAREHQIFKALHSCLATRSFNEISTRELAKMADINHGMLYYFFKDKKDILLHYIDYIFESFASHFQKWLSDHLKQATVGPKFIDEVHEYITTYITLNKEISMIFLELWNIGRRDEAVKAKLKHLYAQWDAIISALLIDFGVNIDTAKKMSNALIAFCEGTVIFVVLIDKDEAEIKAMLDWYKDQFSRAIQENKIKEVV